MATRPTAALGVPGVGVGHWTDADARTGCTVVVLPEGTVASAEVRGGAPATRELDLLAPERTVQHLDAVVLTGGSAFGLASADGVAQWCEREGRGFPTPAGRVPIVAALGVFDLGVGRADVRPGPDAGVAACAAAGPDVPVGPVGAGTGCTVGGWRGADQVRPGGVGVASVADGELVVAAVAVVNAYGDVLAPGEEPPPDPPLPDDPPFGNTTVGVVVTNARLDKLGCLALAQGAHDGLARAVHPPHTSVDGDAVVAAATGVVPARPDRTRRLAVRAFAAAIRNAVG